MLKDLKKKEKEEKKAKKKEEKEEKKAAKEAKKKSKHQATGSTGSNSGSTSPSPSAASPIEAKRATSPGKDSPPSPARSASPARHGGSLSAPGSSGSSQLHVTTTPNNMATLTTTTPVHPNVNTNLFNTSPPAPASPTAVPSRDFNSSPMSLLQKLAAAEEHGAAPLSPLRTMAPEVAPKVSLADFRVIKLIGKGGFGEVYLVEHIEKQKKMAMKVLAKSAILNQTKMQQVLNERAVLVKSFKSPFLLSLNYSFQDQKHLYFAMKYCPGGDLRALLSAIGTFEEDEARLYMAEMIVSVDALHRLGYIHRDLKPDNFLIDAQGHLVLADFGLSKELYESTRASKRISGASSAKLPVSSAIAHVRDRSLSTIQSPPPAHGKSPSVLLGPQDLVSLNAMNVESRFVRRKRRNPASDMSSSFNPMTHSYNPSGTDPFGGSSLPRDSDGFGTGSFIPGSARNSTLFDSDSPMGGSYNPMLASFGAQPVRPVIQFADLPSKAQQRRLMAYSVVGSPDYMSPEVLAEHGYGAEVDWWSVGCLCFELVLGIPPFTGQSIQEVFDNIANWETRLPQILEQYQAYLSPTCFDLLSQLLCDPKKRLGQNGISEIKKHPFFEDLDWDRLRDEEPPFVPRLENEEDTSYFEANVINKQQAFIPTQGVPSPLPSTTPAANPNDYYRQFSYNEADLAPHLKQQPPF
jgi:serine/threonine-protein kinase RIM15